jgi:hypothetical protein
MTRRRRRAPARKAAQKAIKALKMLAESIEMLGVELRSAASARMATAARKGKGGARRRRVLSPKARAFLKQQGRYLGLMRHLPAKHRARVKATKAKRGYPAAIRQALALRPK